MDQARSYRAGWTVENPDVLDVKGQMLPSKKAMHWPENDTRKHRLQSYVTLPQQDMRSDGMGIKILKPIDIRGQPMNGVARANIHDRLVLGLPAKEASCKAVREWFYFILAQRRYGGWVDTDPYVISATLYNVSLPGPSLRKLKKPEDYNYCPVSFTNVDGDRVEISEDLRRNVMMALYETIHPLLAEERKSAHLERKARQERRERKRRELTSSIRNLFCFGRKSSKDDIDGMEKKLVKSLDDDATTIDEKDATYCS